MIITTPALAAAFRLRTQLPVTTNTREYEDPDPGGRIPQRFTEFRRDRIRRMLAEGMTTAEMAVVIGVTPTSIRRHVRAIEKMRKARKRC